MDRERWTQIDQIFHAALDREPSNRSAYLIEACKGDDSLRVEVEALIASHEKESSLGTHSWLGFVYLAQSKKDAAFVEMRKEQAERWRLHGLAIVHHAAGNSNESDRALEELIQKYQVGIDYEIAQVYAYREQSDKAFDWLDRAYQLYDESLLLIKTDPLLRNLHHDARWQSFLKKMNLPV